MARQLGVAVVVVLMTISEGTLKTLFVRHDRLRWALPGGELNTDEPLLKAAERIIWDMLGIKVDYLEQLYTFAFPAAARARCTVEVSYHGLVPSPLLRLERQAEQLPAGWFREDEQPKLVSGHAEIVQVARSRLRGKLAYTAVGFELLPDAFTLVELQQLYEVIMGKVIDKRNFRKKIIELGIVEPTGKRSSVRGRGRPALLFRFKPEVFKQLDLKGDIFPF